jgi:hypothetical protein
MSYEVNFGPSPKPAIEEAKPRQAKDFAVQALIDNLVDRNVKRWRSAAMAMRWTAAAMQEAAKGFRRLKAHKQLPTLRAALEAHRNKNSPHGVIARQAAAA